MHRVHFDTVLMLVTGRVVPSVEIPDKKVVSIFGNHSDQTLHLEDALCTIVGRPIYAFEFPATLLIVGAYFNKEYPEIPDTADFPLIYDDYADWRGSFLTEHDLPDWYELPVLRKQYKTTSEGYAIEFSHDDGRIVTVTI